MFFLCECSDAQKKLVKNDGKKEVSCFVARDKSNPIARDRIQYRKQRFAIKNVGACMSRENLADSSSISSMKC